MNDDLSRRDWMRGASVALGAMSVPALAFAAPPPSPPRDPFRYCLNTITISGQKLPLPEVIDLAAKAGYQAIEPWIREIDQYMKDQGNLKDLAKRIRDHGLVVPDAIGFPQWIVDDEAKRKQGLEEAKRCMDLVAQLGGERLAAPPAGATEQAVLDLFKVAERYRALLELGEKMGVTPQVELWGFSKTLSRLGETALVALETGHSKACILADVYHLHKGGSGFAGLRLLSPGAMQIFHMNDYPADPPRERITDAHRIYPGDGVAPLPQMLADLRKLGFVGFLSLELFNRDYWKQDAFEVAKTGLAKMKEVARKSLEIQ
jgi:sugar phosphate isomerase/epimerase